MIKTSRWFFLRTACIFVLLLGNNVPIAWATEYFVAPGGTGNGTPASPFGSIQSALNAAQAGDVVSVQPGTYTAALKSVRAGVAGAPIRLRALQGRGSVVVTTAGTLFTASHAYVTIEGLVFDGKYALADGVVVQSAATGFVLRDTEVRKTRGDCVDIRSTANVTIEGSLIHHCLNSANGRTDAHGVVAGAVRNLTVRRTDIHTFSGDGVQVDPNRSASGWDNVLIEQSRIWLAPLSQPEAGFAAGTVTGENAVDTKANVNAARARMTIRDCAMWGFRGGLISNMAAMNLKENVDVTVDRVSVSGSEIAFRVRGPGTSGVGAWAKITNAVAYDVTTGLRYEDNLDHLRLWNSTFGRAVTRAFQAASSVSTGLDVRNLLLYATTRPKEAWDLSNRLASSSTFINASADDYHLAATSTAIDAGAVLAVPTDFDGRARPQGGGYDVGAYEASTSAPPPSPTSGEVVLHASKARVFGGWRAIADGTAAGGAAVVHPNASLKWTTPLASPANYFEITFDAEAGIPYRLWVRGRATQNSPASDEAWVQFSSSVDAAGAPWNRIGTTGAYRVRLRECSTCALSGWGWEDTASGVGILGPVVVFAKSGTQTLRVQTCEDGFVIDQIVLSPSQWITTAPGAITNDTTILPEQP